MILVYQNASRPNWGKNKQTLHIRWVIAFAPRLLCVIVWVLGMISRSKLILLSYTNSKNSGTHLNLGHCRREMTKCSHQRHFAKHARHIPLVYFQNIFWTLVRDSWEKSGTHSSPTLWEVWKFFFFLLLSSNGWFSKDALLLIELFFSFAPCKFSFWLQNTSWV